jgi:cation diffusion facilitator CzcD-associated flavoprotein CzcO
VHHFDFVISAVGIFGRPRYPQWPGLEDFGGRVLHTAVWDESVDLRGKRVAVVGTGASSVQVVPTVAPDVSQLYVFQREPGWVLPKADRDYSPVEQERNRSRTVQRYRRIRNYLDQESREWSGALFRPGSRTNRAAEDRCRAYIAETFRDRPDLAAAVTPTYPFAGKRIVITSAFYPALLRDNVELVSSSVQRCTPTGVVDANGVEREVDVIILATGFEVADYLASLDVQGPGGRGLRQAWEGDAFALLGMMVPGFPNFFIMYGPNTNGGLIVSNLEHQAEFVVRQISRTIASGQTTVEARPWIVDVYNRWLQWRLAKTSWAVGNNYFKSPSGRIVTQWSEGAAAYALMTKALRRVGTRRRD